MFLTRTIRRKMVFGLVLVLVMLVVLSLSSISGLISYRDAVRELDASINQTPRSLTCWRRSARCSNLWYWNRLRRRRPSCGTPSFRLNSSWPRQQVREFRRRLEQHSPALLALSQMRPAIDAMLSDIDDSLDSLDSWQSAAGEEGLPPETAERMRFELGAC